MRDGERHFQCVEMLRNGSLIIRSVELRPDKQWKTTDIFFIPQADAAKWLLIAGVDLESAGLGDYVVADLDTQSPPPLLEM